VKYIRYTKYQGEPGGGVDLQELVKRLSDFFLQSGFESQFYGISEMDPEKSMEALRQAIQRALEEGDLMPDEQLQDLLDGTPEQQSAKMKELIDQLMDRLMEEGYVTGQPQVTGPPDKMPRGQVGQRRDRETEARFEITDKTIDFLGFKTLKDLMASLGKSSFGRHDTRDLSTGVESGGVSRAYEFGDTLNLDISATLFNAVRRDGARVPIELDYPDLMVHRLLYRFLTHGKIEQDEIAKYQKLSEESSEREGEAAEAERASIKYKQVEYMSEHIGEEFDAQVSGVSEWGVYVEEINTKSEGMVKLRDMGDDFGPIQDGRLLTESPAQAFVRGHAADLPLILGSNSYEGLLNQSFTVTLASLSAEMRAAYTDEAPPVSNRFVYQRFGMRGINLSVAY